MGNKSGFKQKKGNTRPVSLQFTAPINTSKLAPKSIDVATAGLYLQQAIQALQASNWQEVCRITQLCIAGTHDNIEYHNSAKGIYAAALMKMFEYEQALALWKDIEIWNPNDVVNLGNIGVVLIQLQRYEEAIEYFKHVLIVQPDHIETYLGLGVAYSNNYNFSQAIESYQRALTLNPHSFSTLSSILSERQYEYPFNMDAYAEDLKKCQSFIQPNITLKTRSVCLHKPLRVGFVSGDLRSHPVGYFLESTLAQINIEPTLKKQVTLIAYHTKNKQDQSTQQLKSLFDIWHQVHTWNDDEFVNQIQKDGVDILIDLSGHTDANRLFIFAQKPAHLQVSWLGYWASTGLSSIDYVLADPISVPVSEEKCFVEKIWRLPCLRYCLSVPDDAPEISDSPCLSRQYVTFACYQNVRKINQGVLQCWSRIFAACPHARLRLQSKELTDRNIKAMFIERLIQVGVDIDRVILVDGMDRKDYFASYAEVDILLDTFPFPGGTTTAEALWMGVPTVTLAMPGMLGRQGEALLVNAGLADWVAYSEDEYVQKAIAWGSLGASQYSVLAQLRAGMREQVRQTPVFNEKQFAQDFVAALFAMWQEKCENAGAVA